MVSQIACEDKSRVWVPSDALCDSAEALMCDDCAGFFRASGSVDPTAQERLLMKPTTKAADKVAAIHRLLELLAGHPEHAAGTVKCLTKGTVAALEHAFSKVHSETAILPLV